MGIRSAGAYLPRSCLARKAIAEAWGRNDGNVGTRSVALYDEDALTMAVEAAAEALRGIEARAVGAVYFASSSGPFGEKQASDLLASALDLRSEVLTTDIGGSTRAFTVALRAACDAVRAGSCRNALVVATDMRTATPGSGLEPLLGDGAAAVVVGTEDLLAGIEQTVAISEEFTPVWRLAGDRFLRDDDDKVAAEAYVKLLLQAAKRVLEAGAREPADLARIVAYAPDPGSYRRLLKASGMAERFHPHTLWDTVGNAGAANVALQLQGALEEASAGERLLVLGWGGSADGLLLRATGKKPAARTLAAWQENRVAISYQDYLRYRDLHVTPSGLWSLDPSSSLTAQRREARQMLRLNGLRCEACQAVLYPARPACRSCGAAGPFKAVRLGRRGSIVTWNRDHVFPGPGSPVVNAVVDLDGGGRILTQLAEGDPAAGMAVELTLRKLHEGRGLPHYWWKARDLRGVSGAGDGGGDGKLARDARLDREAKLDREARLDRDANLAATPVDRAPEAAR